MSLLASHPLVRRFELAGLPLVLRDAPLVSARQATADQVVQIDISRLPAGRRQDERFRLWLGATGNRVEVEGVERELSQLVLMIHEPRRRFEVAIGPFANVPVGARVVRKEGRRRWVEQWTSEAKRHFLCGKDEQHLFVAQLPKRVSTVRQAREALRNPHLDSVERGSPFRTVRQGEWFFVALTPAEEASVTARVGARAVVRRHAGLAQVARLGRRGRPHIAEETVALPDELGRELRVYVRGSVRHPDHRTVYFHAWRRVFANTEVQATAAQGVLWVD
jgi:hypothetical protein